MATVHYKGPKAKMPVYFPIGANTRSTIKETRFAEPDIELTEGEAKKLVELDPTNFELRAHAAPAQVHVAPVQAEVGPDEKRSSKRNKH